MKIALIIPAYNEEEFLPVTLNSLVEQDYPIDMIMLVNDGSSDGTESICKTFAESYDNICYVTNLKKEKRASGAKVVRAFNLGLKQIDIDKYDIIAKIDSDIGFPKDYFFRVVKCFESDNQVGLAGGMCMIMRDGKWQDERVANTDHLRGPLKCYRTEAFRQMKGLRTIMGWDTIDEFLLRYLGWKVIVMEDLKVKHFRVTHSINGWYIESVLNGEVFHNLGYNLLIALTSSLKRSVTHKPYLLTGIVSLVSYLKNRIFAPKPLLDRKQKSFINRYRLKQFIKRFG